MPDPSFEDWTGATFKDAIQPKYWNYSNVSQLGIAEFNFAQQEKGRTGSYAMKVQDQDLKVAGIGETSPGYIALGHPWAHVSSLTAISKATAGTYGGIAWTYRPDTMTVWIKRTGPRTADENYNILYYSWIGRSEGKSYKGKDGTCAEVPDTYRFDEESDIRIALDGNECGTVTAGTQVAEGWLFERKTYENWTKVSIPIYYLDDRAPEKCNVIFSASNYPNFRANDGLYAGNTLIVDDVELIYASTIQKVYIGGKEWKAFDGNNHDVQTYSLGQGATVIPQIDAYRGAGKLTCNHGKTVNFPGRKLGAGEITIEKGTVDGDPCRLTVRSEDGKSTSTYLIQFVSQQSNNAKLAGIQYNDTPVSGYNALVNTYNVQLPFGTTEAPVVTVTKQEDSQSVDIVQATSVNGQAVITVTAQDGTTKNTYTINFSVGQLSDNTLRDILVNGKSVNGFAPTKGTYTVELPLSTTSAPEVTPVSAYPTGAQTITIVSNTLDVEAKTGQCKITVSAPAAATTRTYTLNYKITPSSYSLLQMIYLDGEALKDFTPENLQYDITLPIGTASLPAITWTAGDAYQRVEKTEGGVDGVTRLLVTAGSGATSLYRLNFATLKSTNNALSAILIDGEALAGFDADTLDYTILLPAVTKVAPTVTAVPGDEYQTIRVVSGGLRSATRVTVTAGDGSRRIYTITFEVEKSVNALLEMIYVGGEPLEGFAPETTDYRYHLVGTTAPAVTVSKMEGQIVMISQPLGAGVTTIVVQPAEGDVKTYTVTFYDDSEVVIPEPNMPRYEPESVAELQMIYLDGDSLEGFDPMVTDYTIMLPKTVSEQPILTAVTASAKARMVIITQGEANANATVRVIAEDSVTTKDYVLHFPYEKSSNTAPENIDASDYITYVATEHVYSFDLPFEVEFPDVFVTPAEEAQAVAMEYLNCKTRRDVIITVTAEDGTTATYEIHMTKPTHPDNVLRALYANDFFLDSLTLNSADTIRVTLPYDATVLGLTNIEKNYDDQYVVVRDGGVEIPTTIWCYSGRAGEQVKTYTLIPERAQSALWLTGIMMNGVGIDGFAPNQFDYIVRVTDKPVVTATCVAGAMVEVEEEDDKHIVLKVANDDAPHYTVWFYYANDIIPNADFSESAVAQYNNAFKPKYWQVPADGDDSYSWGAQGTVKTGKEVARNSDGTIRLSTTRDKLLNSIFGSIPGMMTLGNLSLSLTSTGNSTSSVAGGVAYRNTPDYLDIEIKPISQSNMNNWRVQVTMDGVESLLSGSYSDLNAWRTERLNLTHPDMVSTLNITINAAHSENAKDLGGGTQRVSQLDVRRISFAYNSLLSGIIYNGDMIAPDASGHFSITVPTEFVGVPTLGFAHSVADQATEIMWKNEVAGVREATIRNYAEDGSYTDYTLTVTRSLSTEAGYTLRSDIAKAPAKAAAAMTSGADVCFATTSPHATAAVAMVADSLVLTITPESGAAVDTRYSAFVHDTIRTSIAAVLPAMGKDSIMTQSEETVYSDELALAYIVIGEDTLASYEPEQLSYTIYTTSATALVAGAMSEQQTITTEHHALSDGSDLYYIYVRAGNGGQRVYAVRQTHVVPSSDATLSAIALDGVALSEFRSDMLTYTIDLPMHSVIPDVLATPADAAASLTAWTSANEMRITVTAEDGVSVNVYSLQFVIPASDDTHLEYILLDDEPLEDFSAERTEYDIVLPIGSTQLPALTYVQTEPMQTVAVDTVALQQGVGQYRLTVTAEDGVSTRVYTLHFTVAKSTNCYLQDILADGQSLTDFYAEMTTPLTISVEYGASMPVITYVRAEETQTVTVDTIAGGLSIRVTAEDGVSIKTYTVLYVLLPSHEGNLSLILLDGDPLAGFDPETYEYEISLPYGATLPEVTYITADEQQTVQLRWEENICYIAVTAGDGETNEYMLQFVFGLNDNALLRDLRVFGKTVEGFRADSLAYTLLYPWTTSVSELAGVEDVVAIAQDDSATVNISITDEHIIMVMVQAADGLTREVYTVEQIIEPNARLKMIYVNGTEIRNFDTETYSYSFELPQTASIADVTAEAEDSLATVDMSVVLIDDTTYIYCTAADGVTTLTYALYLYRSSINVGKEPTMDDVLFTPLSGNSFLAVSLRSGVQVGVYDYSGHLLLLETVPPCDPNDVRVEVDEEGNEHIREVYPGAAGVEFTTPVAGMPYIYVFYKSTTNKRFTKGGKFMGR